MKSHLKNMHQGAILKCSICEKSFKEPSNLKMHLALNHSGANTKKFQCKICEKSFIYRSHLNTHYSTVHKKEYVNCNECEKSFTIKYSLNRHFRNVHQNI